MCCRFFIRFGRLRRMGVPAKYRKQRCKRQTDDDYAADAVDLLPTHGVTSFPASCWRADLPPRFLRGREDLTLIGGPTTKQPYSAAISSPLSPALPCTVWMHFSKPPGVKIIKRRPVSSDMLRQ